MYCVSDIHNGLLHALLLHNGKHYYKRPEIKLDLEGCLWISGKRNGKCGFPDIDDGE